MTSLAAWQSDFLELAQEYQALAFGRFELKSGRVSPYFFNAGKFNSGAALNRLGACYADAIVARDIPFDFLFGPAYKGIPLVAVTAAALSQRHGRDVPWCFNRKEAKDHGEGGMFVGAAPQGRALILDDVITAGTAIRQAIDMLQAAGAMVSAVLIGLDRCERAPDSHTSAVLDLANQYQIAIESIVSLDDIRQYLAAGPDQDLLDKIVAYQQLYGVSTSEV